MQPIPLLLRPEQLLALAKDGDRVALQRLLIANASDTCAYIRQRLPRAQAVRLDAEDVLQLVFLDAFRDIGTLRATTETAFRAWLFQICEHRLRDALKSATRLKRGGQFRQVTTVECGVGSMRALIEQLSNGGRSPSAYLQHDEMVAAVQAAITNLPNDYRRAVEYRYLNGLSLNEVAAKMGRTERAVQGLLDRARRLMREALEPER